jgi:hypothetical protein
MSPGNAVLEEVPYEAGYGINQSLQFAMDWDLLLRFYALEQASEGSHFWHAFAFTTNKRRIPSWMTLVNAKSSPHGAREYPEVVVLNG